MPSSVEQAKADLDRLDAMLEEGRQTLIFRVREQARAAEGRNIAQLAREAGVARSTIYHWITNP